MFLALCGALFALALARPHDRSMRAAGVYG
jgi:hypothetical protein